MYTPINLLHTQIKSTNFTLIKQHFGEIYDDSYDFSKKKPFTEGEGICEGPSLKARYPKRNLEVGG